MYTELLSATVAILLSYALFVHLVLPFYAAIWQDVLHALGQGAIGEKSRFTGN